MKRHTGFSLTELMVVVAIIAILLVIGVPSFRYVTNASRMSSEINGLLGDLMYTRAEAIKEGQSVSLCVSSNGVTCSGLTTWANGWIVFPDTNPPTFTPAVGSVLRQQTAFAGTTPDTLTPNTAITGVSFNRDGFAQAAGGATFPATILTLHDATANAAWTRCLQITLVGMLTTETAVPPLNFAPCI
ncbi:MAG: GspH/FimT family pseudopilin [Steroidobacteraceae bacterium]